MSSILIIRLSHLQYLTLLPVDVKLHISTCLAALKYI